MSPRDEVHRLLGPPEHSFPTWNKSGYSEHYADGAYNVGYDNAWLADHVGFSPGAVEVMINAQLIWSGECQQDPNPIFLALDPEPVEFVGFWNFLQLGVTT